MVRQHRDAFSAGLYGMLLFALCCLTLPTVFAPVERLLVGAASLVPRALGVWSGTPVAAAEPDVRERLRELGAELDARIRQADLESGSADLGRAQEPLLCGVVASERRGGGGQPSELRLDRTYAELAGCSEFVTKGQVLVGFLQRAGRGVAAEDPPDALARVLLLNHPMARAVAAVADLPEGGALRLVVKPAAVVDPAPLRIDLWDDPYRATRLEQGGLPVHTLSLPSARGEPPAGLWLGRTLIWGYQETAAEAALTIGVFVVPPLEPRALSHVVVWRPRTAAAGGGPEDAADPAAAVGVRHPATVWELPGAVHGRHLLAADCSVPDGAAVVQDGWCLGTARGLSFGLGLVTSFAASRQRWSLLLLPEDAAARPRELSGEVVDGRLGRAIVRWRGDSLERGGGELPRGFLFTGSNGPHCPSGLFLGRATPVGGDLLEVTIPVQSWPRAAEVVVGGGAR